jgi:hypothetical protein
MNTISSDILVLAAGIFLFICNFIFDWWLWKKSGDQYSATRGILIKNGIDSTFGVVSASVFLVSVAISYFVLTGIDIVDNVPIKRLLILTVGVYFVLVFFLNIWGKGFLIRQGIDPKPKDGYKGFVQNYKEALEKAKEKQRKKKEDSLFD